VSEQAKALRARAKQFAIRVVKFVRTLPRDPTTDALSRQLAKSGPSVSANYHSTGRARSRAEFVARLAVVVDEADETAHWLSVVREGGVASGAELDWLVQEAGELRAIFSAALMTAKQNNKRQHPGS